MTLEEVANLSNALSEDTEIVLSATSSLAVPPHLNELFPPINTTDAFSLAQSDEDLMSQVSEGSKEALSILFRRHARAVFNVSHRILRDNCEAEDLLQELFLFLFQKAWLYDASKGSAVSWIVQLTYHRAIDRRRHLTARHHYTGQEVNEERQHSTLGQVSIDQFAGRALLNKLREELTPEQRQTLELHFVEGYTFHEIAEKTGQGFGNVRHHYYRGLERLRALVLPEKTRPK